MCSLLLCRDLAYVTNRLGLKSLKFCYHWFVKTSWYIIYLCCWFYSLRTNLLSAKSATSTVMTSSLFMVLGSVNVEEKKHLKLPSFHPLGWDIVQDLPTHPADVFVILTVHICCFSPLLTLKHRRSPQISQTVRSSFGFFSYTVKQHASILKLLSKWIKSVGTHSIPLQKWLWKEKK